ncbi:GNAT family N-acetyltransferase [Romeria aff. gracilis LEGE 07310]|uniref:GNAT family N-acetyltransferase n=1 Tax=Vasconcelosia minhoensis LEGE 07310 TaxID=915328 RepID=A0A8J7DBN4_9CYAN|nr:GNAT family N-acetyltransferase [Romeria gracilis]MBE9076658.1 GNAT family N-acetyltransferase [Romeria aff. gracilis LEGE 07310]
MVTVTIRAIEVNDWEGLAALQQFPKVRRGTLQMPYQSPAVIRRRLENQPENIYQLAAIEPESEQLVGTISLHQQTRGRQHVGCIGMAVRDDFHGQGIGSELLKEVVEIADGWLNLKRLELTVYVDNAPAIHLYQKFGFLIEGTLKKYAFREGRFVDAFTMARII